MVETTKTFHEFEHEGWQQVADGYHDYFGALTTQSIKPLIDALQLKSGMSVLDIASGPGYVARELADRSMKVTAIDFSSVMVVNASRLHPDIQFQEGDAHKLQFADDTFDAACMNFGILHLDSPEDAIKEAHRVIKKNATSRFAFSAWTDPVESAAFGLVLNAIRDHGDANVPIPPGPPFFRFGNSTECERILNESGFHRIETQKVHMTWRLGSVDDLFTAFYGGAPRTGGLLRAQKFEHFQAVKAAITKAAEEYLVDSHVEIPMACMVASGAAAP
ncbi:MAG: class I SAM-dependent methyltransferase [Candidatus Obscuribacterales bacterium]|nr:class I SAM-dependent methyltransferase [Candidatus Obscuribacterales bacterium]